MRSLAGSHPTQGSKDEGVGTYVVSLAPEVISYVAVLRPILIPCSLEGSVPILKRCRDIDDDFGLFRSVYDEKIRSKSVVHASDTLVYPDCCPLMRHEGLHKAVKHGVMSTCNGSEVCFAVVENVWQRLVFMSTSAAPFVATSKAAGTIKGHAVQSRAVYESPFRKTREVPVTHEVVGWGRRARHLIHLALVRLL